MGSGSATQAWGPGGAEEKQPGPWGPQPEAHLVLLPSAFFIVVVDVVPCVVLWEKQRLLHLPSPPHQQQQQQQQYYRAEREAPSATSRKLLTQLETHLMPPSRTSLPTEIRSWEYTSYQDTTKAPWWPLI